MKKYIWLLIILIFAVALPVYAVRKFQGTTAFQRALIYPNNLVPGSAVGVVAQNGGELRRQIYKVNVGKTAFVTNGTTSDVTLATLAAKTTVYRLIADVTEAFACTATCTSSTLSMTCGKTAGGNAYLLSFDVDAAIATFGDAAAEEGASLTEATTPLASGFGDIPSMSATTTLQCRLTSGTGAIGNGTATNLSAGAITFYLDYAVLP